jgi:hypothetical protein
MTKMLERAFTEASKLSPSEQDALAALLLSKMNPGGEWILKPADAKTGLCLEGNVLVHRGVCSVTERESLAGVRDDRLDQLSEGLKR